LAPDRPASYRIEKTGEAKYEYSRKETGKQRVAKTFDAKDDKNRSNAAELLVVLFKHHQTGFPLFGFLPELVNLLGSLFASEQPDVFIASDADVIFSEDADLETEFRKSIGQAASWVLSRHKYFSFSNLYQAKHKIRGTNETRIASGIIATIHSDINSVAPLSKTPLPQASSLQSDTVAALHPITIRRSSVSAQSTHSIRSGASPRGKAPTTARKRAIPAIPSPSVDTYAGALATAAPLADSTEVRELPETRPTRLVRLQSPILRNFLRDYRSTQETTLPVPTSQEEVSTGIRLVPSVLGPGIGRSADRIISRMSI
jgi:hypothetical protein